jgi:hypothetical protein
MMKRFILHSLILFALTFQVNLLVGQSFTWMKGSSSANQPGGYGTLGVASAGNNPGARQGSCIWNDGAGNFWLFGGYGYDFIGNSGHLNDLWKYNKASGNWTWVSGANVFLQLGTYGTLGTPSTSNCPGARHMASSWIDNSGNLWLFGGQGYGSTATMGQLNDLWKFNVTTSEWTWMGGANVVNSSANYGTAGTSAPTNIPGARSGSAAWKDNSGNFWMHGGTGITTSAFTVGYLNDLWKYDLSTNEWTWMHGTAFLNQNGLYGTMGTPSAANFPGGRQFSSVWKDNTGSFWLFGGSGYDATSSTTGILNDLWKYNPSANQWTWMKGNNIIDQAGIYGTLTVPSATIYPGSRFGSSTWLDAVGNYWLFGGSGFGASSTSSGTLNDLWKYNASTNQWTWIRGSSSINQLGSNGTMGIPSAGNTPGSRAHSAYWIDASNNPWFFGGAGMPGTGPAGLLNDLWTYKNCYINPIIVNIISNDSTICVGEKATLSAIGSNNFTWSNGTFSASIIVNPTVVTTYTVYTADTTGCVYNASFTQSVSPCLGLSEGTGNELFIYPNPGNGLIKLNRNVEEGNILIYNMLGQKVFQSTLPSNGQELITGLPGGVYHCILFEKGNAKLESRLVISGNR